MRLLRLLPAALVLTGMALAAAPAEAQDTLFRKRGGTMDVEIDEIIRSLDSRSLARAARQIEDAIPAARILVTRAERALDAGDLDEAADAQELNPV